MSTPEDNTRISLNEDTVISSSAAEDTIISVPDEHTVIADDLNEHTSVAVTQVVDHTVMTAEDTVITVDERTVASTGLNVIDVDLEGPSDSDTAPQQEILSRYRLRHLNGTKYLLNRPVVFGRMPTVPVRGVQQVNLVVVSSPEGVVSGTHARVEVTGDVVVVTDLRSTNGTRIIMPGKPSTLLGPGDSFTIPVGAIIDLGDGNRIELLG